MPVNPFSRSKLKRNPGTGTRERLSRFPPLQFLRCELLVQILQSFFLCVSRSTHDPPIDNQGPVSMAFESRTYVLRVRLLVSRHNRVIVQLPVMLTNR